MANIARLFKQEISRLVRRELKTETESLRKASSRYRAEIAELKRRIAGLEQQLKAVERQGRHPVREDSPAPESAATFRFSAAGLKKLRERHALSATTLGEILGTSAQTIYNWESGKTRPGRDQVEKMAVLRKMGKRDVKKRLATLNAAA